MKKIFLVVAASAVMLTACGAQGATPTQVTVTATETAVAPQPVQPELPAQSDDGLYVSGVRSIGNPLIARVSDAELIDMGQSVCDALSTGLTVDQVIAYMAAEMAKSGATSDTELEAVGTIIAGAVTFLCPQYSNNV